MTAGAVGTDTALVTSAGIVTPSVGTSGPAWGRCTVEVVIRNAAKVSDMPVTTSGTRAFSDLTNGMGCAVFGYIPIGGYTGTATTAGWVDRDGNPTATGSATVSQGNVSTVQLTYDVAGSLAVTLDGAAPRANAKLNVSQPAFVTPHTLTPAITAGQTTVPTIGSLFPFKISPYNAYVGSCADADPSKYSQPVASTLVTPGSPATPWASTAADRGDGHQERQRSDHRRQREDHFDSHRLRRIVHRAHVGYRPADRPDALWALRGLR